MSGLGPLEMPRWRSLVGCEPVDDRPPRTLTCRFSLFAPPKIMRVFVLLGWLIFATGFAAAEETERPPNFIVILCDDLGYADIGPFGSEKHRTPNLDRMAEEGRVFTSFYVTSGVCSPSRASLMTGCYPKRVGLHENESGAWVLFPGDQRGLNRNEVTLAEMLKNQGYATGIIGKWHLGDQVEFLPSRHGFDYYYGIPYANDMGHQDRPKPYRYPPLPLLRNEKVIEEEPNQAFLTQNYTREAIAFMTLNRDRPFFLYLPHTMPHWPQYSSPRFSGKSANGPWGDTVEEIDWSTGQILKGLRDLGIDEHTMVVFLSDNGGATRHGASNAPLRGAKGSTWEGGQRVPFVAWWPDRIPAGTRTEEIATSMDLLPTLARLAGAEVPAQRKIDGKDIWPLLKGEPRAKTPHEAFYYYFKGDLEAVRSGEWKYRVVEPGWPKNRGEPKPLEPALSHLPTDPGEAEDVGAENPEVVARMEELLELARRDLGDDRTARKGEGTRESGFVENARTLTD